MSAILSFCYRSRCNVVFCIVFLLSILTVEGALIASTTPQIAGGGNHTIALKSDGTVRAWGFNSSGQLGDGTTTDRSTPVQVSNLNDVIAIAGGFGHTIALKSDGTVWTWGWNAYGQLGEENSTSDSNAHRKTTAQVSNMSGITAIAGGYSHTIALKSDGTVWTWGENNYGQLGDGTTSDKYTPVKVSGLNDVTAIASGRGYFYTIALKSDGTVWAWGYNYHGQLGDGSNTDKTTPVQVSGLSGVTAIASGGSHTIVLKSDGTVWACGSNVRGQLGDGTTTNKNTPVQVSGLSGVTAIAGGVDHTIALKSDGTVWAWGYNEYGQLGDGTTTNKTTPVQVSGLSGVTAIAGGSDCTIVLKSDGTVWACGSNGYGQLGDGTTTNRTTPVQVSNLILKPAIPTVSTTSVTNITSNSATLNGIVNANDAATTAWFEYGTTSGVYSYSTTTETVSGMSDTTISKEVNGLSSGTIYYYRVVAQNSEGMKYGSETSFTTLSPPTTITGTVTNITSTSATMNGTVNAQGTATTAWFDYGTLQGSYGNKTAQRNVTGSSDTTVSIAQSGLSSNTTYFYHIAAQNSAGTTYGSEYSFTTFSSDTTTTSTSSTSTTLTTASTTTTTSSTTSTTTSSTTTTTLPTLPTPTLPPMPTPVASPSPVPTLPPLPTPMASPSPVHEGIVFGIVYDESDNPLADVMVTITGNNVYKDTTTDNDGYYEFSGLAAGSYTLEYEMEGYKDQSQEIRLKAEDTMEVESVTMEVVVIGTIYGYVVNIQGNPIEDARVRLKGVRTKVSKSTASDADGFFEIKELEADTYLLFAKKKRFKKTKVTVRLKEGEDKEVEIEMKRTTKRLKDMFIK